MTRKARLEIFLPLAAILLIGGILSVRVLRPPDLFFWGESLKPGDLAFDVDRQLKALRAADPARDANAAFAHGDRYLIANRSFPGYTFQVFYLGIPDTPFAARAEKTWPHKYIARPQNLQTNSEFARLKDAYETTFNQTIIRLAETKAAD